MSEKAESYMAGWKAGYHNATQAEQKRILDLLKGLEKEKPKAAWSPQYILKLITKEKETNEIRKLTNNATQA